MTPLPAPIHALRKLIHHHPLEHIRLVVDVRERVVPEGVEDGVGDEEAADAHPEAVGEGDDGEGDDEVGEEGGGEDDEGFGGEEVEEEPEDPVEEGGGVGAEVGEPVGYYGEED